MRKSLLVGAVVFCGAAMLLTVGARRAAAQGPAGAGAAAAAQDRSHSYNPMHWVKKDSRNSGALGNRSEAEKKLTPILQSEGVLAANTNATGECEDFADVEACLAALHATHDLGLNFVCVRASVTGVHTSADVSGCKDADHDKPQSLKTVIRVLKPSANAKQAAKNAQLKAKEDLQKIGA